jgi:hypothetical protein
VARALNTHAAAIGAGRCGLMREGDQHSRAAPNACLVPGIAPPKVPEPPCASPGTARLWRLAHENVGPSVGPMLACIAPSSWPGAELTVTPQVSLPLTHASCALGCGGVAPLYGLEHGGTTCVCPQEAQLAAAARRHASECARPSPAVGAIMRPEAYSYLPFGGVEAVAVFRANHTLARIDACATGPRAVSQGLTVSMPRQPKRAVPSLKPCAQGDAADATAALAARWSVYFQLAYPPLGASPGTPLLGATAPSAKREGGSNEATGFAVCLGCWPEALSPSPRPVKHSTLAKHGAPVRDPPMKWVQAAPMLTAEPPSACGSLYACSRACRNYSLFALSAANASSSPGERLGVCMCADMPSPAHRGRRATAAVVVLPPPVPTRR